MDKLRALFTTGSGLSLIALFVGTGLAAIQSHFTGSVYTDIGLVISILGMFAHPTTMAGGHSIPKRG